MNTNTWAWIIAVIVVVGGIWYFATHSSSGSSSQTTTGQATGSNTTGSTGNTTSGSTTGGSGVVTSPVGEVKGVGSIQDLMGMKQNLACTINLSTSKLQRSGSVYVAGGLMRGDFYSTTNGQTSSVSMIDNGTSLYVWNTEAAVGLQLSAAVSANGSVVASRGGIDPATAFKYICHPWRVTDASFFVPDSSVSFSTTQS